MFFCPHLFPVESTESCGKVGSAFGVDVGGNDSIDCAAEYGACVCGLPCADTILHSKGGEYVEDIPVRSELYSGQAPDSFRLAHFIQMQDNLTEEQKKVITGTSQICTMNNQPIHLIEGDAINFKITTDSDLLIVRTLLGGK